MLLAVIHGIPLWSEPSEAETWGRSRGLEGYHNHLYTGELLFPYYEKGPYGTYGYMAGDTHESANFGRAKENYLTQGEEPVDPTFEPEGFTDPTTPTLQVSGEDDPGSIAQADEGMSFATPAATINMVDEQFPEPANPNVQQDIPAAVTNFTLAQQAASTQEETDLPRGIIRPTDESEMNTNVPTPFTDGGY
jgi:hypothetical protein